MIEKLKNHLIGIPNLRVKSWWHMGEVLLPFLSDFFITSSLHLSVNQIFIEQLPCWRHPALLTGRSKKGMALSLTFRSSRCNWGERNNKWGKLANQTSGTWRIQWPQAEASPFSWLGGVGGKGRGFNMHRVMLKLREEISSSSKWRGFHKII